MEGASRHSASLSKTDAEGALNMRKIIRTLIHTPMATLAALLAVTLLFASQLPKLRIETSLYDLIIQDLPESIEYAAFKERFGNEEIILVAVRSEESVFNGDTFARVRNISDSLTELEGVDKIVSLPEIKKAMDLTDQWSLEDFRAVLAPVSLFRRNILSLDEKTTVMCLMLKDVKYKETLIREVDRIIHDAAGGLTVYQIGIPVIGEALEQTTLRDFKVLPGITLGIISLVLFFCFRNARGILLPLSTVLMSLVWTFGLMAWSETPVSMVTMIAPILMIALGTAYTLHIMSHYFSLARSRIPPEEAVLECMVQLSLPTFVTSITTIIGFASLLVSRIDSIQQFAAFSCFGIVSIVVCSFALIPAVLVKLPPPSALTLPSHEDYFQRFIKHVITLNRDHQKIILITVFALTVLALIGAMRIQVETDALGCFKKTSPVHERFEDISGHVAGSSPVNVILGSETNGFWQELENIKLVEDIQAHLNTLERVDKSISWVDYIKLIRYANNSCETEYYSLPQFPFEVSMGVNYLSMMLGQDLLKRFANDDFTEINILLRTHICSSKDFLETEERIQSYLETVLPRGTKVEVTGLSVAIAHSARALTLSQIEGLCTSLGLIFLVMALLLYSFKGGLVAILPNLFPIALLFGIMGWFEIKLSLVTSLIATIAIGIAVDDAVHYLTVYNQEYKKDCDKILAMERTMLTVGKPITYTSVCIVAGFSILMLSDFQPTAVFGLLMVLTMLGDMIGNLLILPIMTLHIELLTLWDLITIRLGEDPQNRIPLFKGMSRWQVRHVLWAGFFENFRAEKTIFNKNDPADSMYAIVSGSARVVVDNSAGKEKVIAELKQGDIFGEMGFIRSRPRSATVIASEDTELLRINHPMIHRLQRLFPLTSQKFFFNLVCILCDRLEAITRRFVTGGEKTEDGREKTGDRRHETE